MLSARALAAIGVGVVLITSTGCARGPSKEEFVQSADPVCRTANSELAGITRPVELKQLGEVAGKVHGATAKQVDGLRKLDQPDDDKKVLTTALGAMESTRDAAKRVQDGAVAGDTRTVETAVGDLRRSSEQADASAREYGLTQCGVGAKDASKEVDEAAKDVLKKEFIAKADALCADAERKAEALPEPRDLKGVVRLLDEGLALQEKLVADIKALHVPQVHQAAWNDVVAAQEKVLAKGRELREAAAANDQTRAERIAEEVDPLEAEASKKADAFGFKDCGTPT